MTARDTNPRTKPGRRGAPLLRLLVVSLACLALGACANQKVRNAEGKLGLDAETSSADTYVALAAEYLRRGQMDTALRRALQAVQEDDSNPRSHYVLALVYQVIGQSAKAEQSFNRAIQLSPQNPDVRNAYGGFLCDQGQYSNAQEQFAKALNSPLYSTPWTAYTNSGICADKAGDRVTARAEYQRALGANPRFGPALVKMATLEYDLSKYKAAKKYLDQFFRTNVATPEALALGVRIERKLGHRKTAATYEQYLRKNFPGAPQTLQL